MTKRPPATSIPTPVGSLEPGTVFPLEESARLSLLQYFEELGDQEPHNLYRQVIEAVERPLLEEVLVRSRGNLSQASRLLGISRATLRKRLQRYGQL
ncbi:MAG: helix-turn-helix domain-containing protein [Pseudomonadota bacterium]